MRNELIMYSKEHIRRAIRWQIEAITELASLSPVPECLNNLSIVLVVLRRCFSEAPDIKGLPSEAANKVDTNHDS